jgi:hypothetical protein
MTVPGIVRSEPDMSGSLDPFRERLAETVAWCLRRMGSTPLAEALRSPSLAPPAAVPWPETVHAVATARLHALGRSWRRAQDPLGGGLLLVYFPTPPHSRGAARSASEGYFDSHDAPPWDTWAAYIEEANRSYLVTWVPPQALGAVTAALDLAPRSLAWLENAEVELSGFGH